MSSSRRQTRSSAAGSGTVSGRDVSTVLMGTLRPITDDGSEWNEDARRADFSVLDKLANCSPNANDFERKACEVMTSAEDPLREFMENESQVFERNCESKSSESSIQVGSIEDAFRYMNPQDRRITTALIFNRHHLPR